MLFDRLKQCDPESAGRLHPNDTYRIIRALEVFESTGRTIGAYHRDHDFTENPYCVLKIGLTGVTARSNSSESTTGMAFVVNLEWDTTSSSEYLVSSLGLNVCVGTRAR